MSAQLEFDGLGEAKLYHDSRRPGFFSVLWREPAPEAFEDQCGAFEAQDGIAGAADVGRTHQKSYRLEQMGTVISLLPKDRDTYLSQAEFFRPNRRLVNLLRLPLCFVDVDTYRSEYAAVSLEQALRDIRQRLEDEGLPHPSIALSSGRGLQLKWLLQGALPRQALPRWTAVQRALCEVLEPFGGDAKALDASRVLRLVDTVNTKSGRRVEVVYTQERNGRVAHFDFDELADAALPYTRQQLEAMRAEAARKQVERPRLVVVKGGRHGLNRGTWAEYNWLRVEDLRQLVQMRYGPRGAPEGYRDIFVFLSVAHMALALGGVSSADVFYREGVQLAKEIAPTLPYREVQAYTSTVCAKARQAAAGERVTHNGRQYSPLYTYRTDTLLELLRIEAAEQRELRVLISGDESVRRHRERETERRRKVGAVERGAYVGQAAEKRSEALRLAQAGMKQKDIAQALGVSQPRVSQLLKEARREKYKCPCA